MKTSLWIKSIRNILLILLGNSIYALAVVLFILPSGIISGGTMGLALFFYHQFGIPISTFVAVFNCAMFILGALILGKKFALTTLLSTFYYPFILDIFQRIPILQQQVSDTLLSTLYAGLMVGVGLGIVIRNGASTGGMDIPPLVLNKKFGWPVSKLLYLFDCCILVSQMLYSSWENILYGLLLVLIYTMVLDRVLMMGRSSAQVKIMSEKYQEINQAITNTLNLGSTLIRSESGYLHENGMIVLTVLPSRELPKLNQLVLSIDPAAFMVIGSANEVKGRGFTLSREVRTQDIQK